MPFRSALSGLNAATSELRVIGNNVANTSTTGFKKSRAEFADVYASSNLGAASNAIGTGVKISAVSQQFSQGNIEFTDNNLDLAVSGAGFFIMNDNGVDVFTRSGAFGVDRNDNIVNSAGQILTGYPYDSNGNALAIGDLVLDRSPIAPQATSTLSMALNVDASDAIPGAPSAGSAIALANTTFFDNALVDGAAGDPFSSASFQVMDNFGTLRTLHVDYALTNDATETWTATLVDETTGATAGSFPATATIDASGAVGANLSPSTLTFNWIPSTANGIQSSVAITLDMASAEITNGTGSPAVGAALVGVTAAGTPQASFDATDSGTYNHSTSLTVFDSLGTSHLASMYFRKTSEMNVWEVFTLVDGVRVDDTTAGTDILTFDTDGSLSGGSPTTLTTTSFIPSSTNTSTPAPITITMSVPNVTQYGSAFSVNSLSQNGYTTGQLSGVDIGETGIITARFTNGQSSTIGEIALANFSNEQGLQQQGDSTWGVSFESGPALVGTPATGSLGVLVSGALEGSNVDLTEQLVALITAQRNFQANAQVIETADAVTQTIINIR